MRQIIEYITIKSQKDYLEGFDEKVIELIKKGFQPFGNPYVTPRSEGQQIFVFQAMVRYKEE